jgi:hypothetical protein
VSTRPCGAVGEENFRWAGGKTIRPTGYVRRTAGKYRDQYEHKAVTLENIEAASFVSVPNLADRIRTREFEIHHFDGDRSHNCGDNLQILQKEIHRAIEHSKQKNLGVEFPVFPWQRKRERECRRAPK